MTGGGSFTPAEIVKNLLLISILLYAAGCGKSVRPVDCPESGLVSHLSFAGNITVTRVVENSAIAKINKKMLQTDRDMFVLSKKYYDDGKYQESLGLAEKLYKIHPEDLFVTEFYAKVLYRFEDKHDRSYALYRLLINAVNRFGYEEIASIKKRPVDREKETVINFTFLEAYWKLGCLHMDYGKFMDALNELQKVAFLFGTHKNIMEENKKLAEDCYSYITEAAFHLKLVESNRYFYCRTKSVNPSNTYVDKYRFEQ
ncbi:MAG: hypothetical protein MUD12_02940 [Spirochaetes bacterium]|jgi:tetratricopeptide (TPR) repeat protein|nr:hypothetical protein [Spirochaetota bacterium]